MSNESRSRQRGLTLVELIIAMVIIGVAVAGMIAAFSRADRASVDPVIHKQLATLAEGMMEEILLKPFDVAANTGTARSEFNDVRDFDNFTMTGITDINGDPLEGLGGYTLRVRVEPVTLSNATTALRITVTVQRGPDTFTLTGWRTDFA